MQPEVRFVRGMVRITTTIIALASVLILGLQPVSSAPAPVATQPADLRRAAVVLAFFDAINRSDAAAMAATFADNAFYVSAAPRGLCALEAPCYGLEKIREIIDQLAKAPHLCETVTSLQVTGSFVIGRVEIRNDLVRGNGIERIVTSLTAQVLQDKMVVFFNRPDLADPDTARNAAIVAGTQPKGAPITVVPPCG